jgi:hypothetical protein
MTDADYIETVARYNDRQEILCRSEGMFETAQWYQWAADRVRRRQPVLATRGCGGTSLQILLSDGLLSVSGDMDPDDTRAAGQHLIDLANDESIEAFAGAAHTMIGQVQTMIAAYNAIKGVSRELTVEIDEGPY